MGAEGVLECGDYKVFVLQRDCANERIAAVCELPFTGLEWNRVLDTFSTATLTIDGIGEQDECCRCIQDFADWCFDLGVYRNFGSGYVRVWSGPIVDRDLDGERFTLTAWDVMGWNAVRILFHGVPGGGYAQAANGPILAPPRPGVYDIVLSEAETIWREFTDNAMIDVTGVGGGGVPPAASGGSGAAGGLGCPWLEVRRFSDVTRCNATRNVTWEDLAPAIDHIAELSRTSIDWTVIDRTIVGGGALVSDAAGVPLPSLGFLVDDHLAAFTRSNSGGLETATRVFVTGGGNFQGTPAQLLATSEDLNCNACGPLLIERRFREDLIEDQGTLDQNALGRRDFLCSGEFAISNVQLTADAPFCLSNDFQTPFELVPGRTVDVRLQETCFPISGDYRIHEVSVNVSPDSVENVSLRLLPVGLDQGCP